MPANFSADHIAAQAGGFEPQRLNHYSIRFSGLGQSDIIEQSLLNFTPPHREVSKVTIPYANEERHVAGKVTTTDMNLVIVDYTDKDTWKDFNDWLNLVHDPRTGAIGMASQYKKEGTISYYGPNGENRRTWKAIGCWPMSVQPAQFGMDNAEKNELTVPLACDKCVPESDA